MLHTCMVIIKNILHGFHKCTLNGRSHYFTNSAFFYMDTKVIILCFVHLVCRDFYLISTHLLGPNETCKGLRKQSLFTCITVCHNVSGNLIL